MYTYNFSVVVWGALFSVVYVCLCVCVCACLCVYVCVGMYDAVYVYVQRSLVVLGVIIVIRACLSCVSVRCVLKR